MGQRWDQFVTNLGNQSAPFGFAPGVDPKMQGMNVIGGIGANMLSNITQNPLEAFGGAYKQQMADSRDQSRDALSAKVIFDQMEEKKQARAREQELEAQFNQYVMGLPPDQQALARFNKDAFIKSKIEATMGTGKSNKLGLNPIWGTGPDGKPALFQLSETSGQPEQVRFPKGFTPQPGVQYIDIGTGYVPSNKRTGLPEPGAAVIPKDVAGEAKLKVEGKDTGEAAALYKSLSSKMPGLQKVVADLEVLADQATYTKTGQLWDTIRKETGMEPRESAVARAKYIAMVDNQVLPMLRDTFGAQFTVVEGQSLRATLGDPDKTPEEKKAVLTAFIEQKVRNIEAAALQGDVDTSQAQPIPAPRLRFNPVTGDFE